MDTLHIQEKSYQNRESLLQLREKYNQGRCDRHIKMALSNAKNQQRLIQSQQVRFIYIPYNCDHINDTYWGCAWRAIQMMLSFDDSFPTFDWLFSFFGDRNVLEDIYALKSQTQKKLDSKFAPHELSNGWAEPFIGNLISYFLGLRAELFLVNSYPLNANAPNEVFECTINFEEFCIRLQQQFNCNHSPVMIDDATYAMVIYGIDIQKEIITLSIADPHIYSNTDNIDVGCYEVYLDLKGNQISNSIKQEEKAQYIYVNSYEGIQFYDKPWMVTLVTDKFDEWTLWKTENLLQQ